MSAVLPALPDALRELVARLPPRTEAYLVGGAVRDLLLGRPLVDFDLAVPRGAVALARRLADGLGAAFVALDDERGVARVVWEREGGRLEVDVADFRAEDLEGDLRARDLTINAMAMPLDGGRDAAAVPELIDPAGGRRDLRDGVVRLLSPAVLRDDPLRTLRAVRVAAQLGFRLDADSAAWIAEAAPLLPSAAPERIREELWKCIVAPCPAATLRRLDELGLLAIVLPEVVPAHGMAQSPPHREDVWEHSLSVVEQTAKVIALVQQLAAGDTESATNALLQRGVVDADRAVAESGIARGDEPTGGADPDLAAALAPFASPLAERLARPFAADHQARGLLLLAALFHDLGKPRAQSVGEDGRIHFYGHEQAGARLAADRLDALRFAQAEVQQVSAIVRHHMRPLQLQRPAPLSPRSLHRYHRATGEVGPEVCLLSLADNLAKGAERTHGAWPVFLARVGELLDAFFFRHDELVAPPPLLRGGELAAELGVAPGPWTGELLRALAESQATGEVRTREEALATACAWWQEHGNA
ncbi:MAG TPA: HD domain-containing protein [Thermoanaerobaculia bacterium]|nr:HD domain-containing protein [Thermoanaerobaculia bacterium]